MSTAMSASELREMADRLDLAAQKYQAAASEVQLDRLKNAAREVGKAWSGSWLGYHATVYYRDLRPPPPGAHFSAEWGLKDVMNLGSRGEWEEWDPDVVRASLLAMAGDIDLTELRELSSETRGLLDECRDAVQSILQSASESRPDSYLERLAKEAEGTAAFTSAQYLESQAPKQFHSRDSLAAHQGIRVPPHESVQADVFALNSPAKNCVRLSVMCRKAASHLERREQRRARESRIGTSIFIGHGRSALWRELKDFIDQRLQLPWDEFNRVPIAGITNIARLVEMLDAAAFALIVLTAEDEQVGGGLHARQNVVHEVGLFQGRIGFTRAIVLLEEGCEEFSNIQGLGQIRFPAGNIAASFEDVRQVLEREGLLRES